MRCYIVCVWVQPIHNHSSRPNANTPWRETERTFKLFVNYKKGNNMTPYIIKNKGSIEQTFRNLWNLSVIRCFKGIVNPHK